MKESKAIIYAVQAEYSGRIYALFTNKELAFDFANHLKDEDEYLCLDIKEYYLYNEKIRAQKVFYASYLTDINKDHAWEEIYIPTSPRSDNIISDHLNHVYEYMRDRFRGASLSSHEEALMRAKEGAKRKQEAIANGTPLKRVWPLYRDTEPGT